MTSAPARDVPVLAGIDRRMPSGDWLVSAGSHYWFLPSWDAADGFCQGYNAALEVGR